MDKTSKDLLEDDYLSPLSRTPNSNNSKNNNKSSNSNNKLSNNNNDNKNSNHYNNNNNNNNNNNSINYNSNNNNHSNYNVPVDSNNKTAFKTELHVLYLSEDSRELTMQTLTDIYGNKFRLEETPQLKGREGKRIKEGYWEDRGTLRVQGMVNFSAKAPSVRRTTDDPLQQFALMKLENYGFPADHCFDAYQHCEFKVNDALWLLYRKYMRVVEKPIKHGVCREDLLSMRNEEREALASIYDKDFEEKEKNTLWSLKIRIEHLLIKRDDKPNAMKLHDNGTKKKKPLCRNYERSGSCRFGNQCRFSHNLPAKTPLSEDIKLAEEKWINLEVHFPPDSQYPYEAPFIFIKCPSGDIQHELQLRLTHYLYREACVISRDAMPCIYSISELLQSDTILDMLNKVNVIFPNAAKSLFEVDAQQSSNSVSETNYTDMPTHYSLGQTSHGGRMNRGEDEVLREDWKLIKKFRKLQKDSQYRDKLAARKKLPAFDRMSEILALIKTSQVLVISGETGCGKSTQVPQFILDNWLDECAQMPDDTPHIPHVEIVCTQPRRLSAMGVAARVADERADRLGLTVGYQIRLENKISASTRLTFCTTGILLRRLTADPCLSSVTHIIIDEVHERSEESDFLLNILKGLLPQRPDLKVLLMSATLNADIFSNYFGKIPVLNIPGRTFPVEQLFLEDMLEVCDYVLESNTEFSRHLSKQDANALLDEFVFADTQSAQCAPPDKIKDENLSLPAIMARYSGFSQNTCKTIYLMDAMKVNTELIECVLKYIVQGDHEWPQDGTILIFLPGLQEIQSVYGALCNSAQFAPKTGRYELVPLHSALNSEEQSAVFRRAAKGKRKIVLSTNIAETSVTIDDCVFVVDCGLMKEKHFDANRNMESLDLVWETRANAKQRQGRAGRVMPGVCIHLFTSHRFHHGMLAQPVPEIHRVPLEQLCLRIKTLEFFAQHKSVLTVMERMLEPPTAESVMSAVVRLQSIGAFDAEENLTSLGHHLAALPVDVRIGKLMLFGAIFQCLDSVLTIAACLSSRSPFMSSFNNRAEANKRKREFAILNSDHLTALVAYNKWLEVSRRSISAGRNYANEHYLSYKTMESISDIKYQFLELLVSIGFVPINVPRRRKNTLDNVLELTGEELNMNGNNYRLLTSLLYASLYPNIVKILSAERSYVQTVSGAMPKASTARDLRFKTKQDGYIAIHPSSVNADIGSFSFPFLVFQEKIKTSRIYIRECSMLTAVPLVLFAGSDLKIERHKDDDYLFILEDGWIILKAHNHAVAQMIQYLRVELFKILDEKIRDPCLNLLHHANGRKIIHNIIYLISKNM